MKCCIAGGGGVENLIVMTDCMTWNTG